MIADLLDAIEGALWTLVRPHDPDDGKYAPPIRREVEPWPGGSRPGGPAPVEPWPFERWPGARS